MYIRYKSVSIDGSMGAPTPIPKGNTVHTHIVMSAGHDLTVTPLPCAENTLYFPYKPQVHT